MFLAGVTAVMTACDDESTHTQAAAAAAATTARHSQMKH
jgi:hypothetical protein